MSSDEKSTEASPTHVAPIADATADDVVAAAKNLTLSDATTTPAATATVPNGEEAVRTNGQHVPTGGHRNRDNNNEDCKVFVGGVSADTNDDDLREFFGQFGEVVAATVKYDRITGRSRGFAFVEFADPETCKKALVTREHTIKDKQIEVKPAKSRENKKVFVGGLLSDYPEPDLREHFSKYGQVEDIEWPFDRQRNVKRNFAFIVFDTEQGADAASADVKQLIGDRECDVKKATPQSRRAAAGGPMVGMWNQFGGGQYAYPGQRMYFDGGRGGMRNMHGWNAQYSQAPWPNNMAGYSNDWNSWNQNAAAAAAYGNYYQQYGHGGAAPSAPTGTDYWASGTGGAPSAQGGGAWGAYGQAQGGASAQGGQGGTFDSYTAAAGAQGASRGGHRQPPFSNSFPTN